MEAEELRSLMERVAEGDYAADGMTLRERFRRRWHEPSASASAAQCTMSRLQAAVL